MFKSLRSFVESILFAGIQPGGKRQAEPRTGWFGRLRDRIDRFISGGRPKDPLYLSNRTWGQRLRLAAVVAVPCLVIAIGVAIILSGAFRPKAPPPKELSPGELLSKMLPDLEKQAHIEINQDAEVTVVHVEPSNPPRVAGTLKNNTTSPHSFDLTIDFADENGSHVGSDSCTVEKAAASTTTNFTCPLRIPRATYAQVRLVKTLN